MWESTQYLSAPARALPTIGQYRYRACSSKLKVDIWNLNMINKYVKSIFVYYESIMSLTCHRGRLQRKYSIKYTNTLPQRMTLYLKAYRYATAMCTVNICNFKER